jgi:hypothetical protein
VRQVRRIIPAERRKQDDGRIKKQQRKWDKANYLRQQKLAQLEQEKKALEDKQQSEARDDMIAGIDRKIDELRAVTMPTADDLSMESGFDFDAL